MFNLHYTCEQCFIKTGVMHTQQLALCLICITPVNSVLYKMFTGVMHTQQLAFALCLICITPVNSVL